MKAISASKSQSLPSVIPIISVKLTDPYREYSLEDKVIALATLRWHFKPCALKRSFSRRSVVIRSLAAPSRPFVIVAIIS